jgi:hypothetical protein
MSEILQPSGPGQARQRRRGGPGRLKIGDEWMAIQIIARSQTNPQKAVAELVENSIDAGATRIHVTRGRKRGRVFLRVSDDGRGVPLTTDGIPDFDYVATHICDSLKRRLDERQRAGVQGEFGIGLLGFWSIGRELEMVSQAGDAPPHVMTMRSGSRAYDRRRYLGARAGAGVDVTIHEVHREAQSRLTAERLQRYLGEELRERIRRAGVTIVIEDRLPPRRTLEVRPVIYKGERIDELSEIPVAGRPPIKAEVYLVARDEEGEKAGAERPVVALYRLGTRVCRDISELPEFAREPWSAGGIEGALDYADFQLSPTSREGFVPDAAYHAFVEAMRAVEPALMERLRLMEEARSEQASRSLVRELQSAFARLLRDLPSGEYDWFGAEGPRPFAGGGDGRPGGASAPPGGAAFDPEGQPGAGPSGAPGGDDLLAAAGLDGEEAAAEAASGESAGLPQQPALLPGPLDRVEIRPGTIRVAVGRRRSVTAVPLDPSGLVLERGIHYSWTLSPGVGSLSVESDGRATVEGGPRPARGTLTVRVREEDRSQSESRLPADPAAAGPSAAAARPATGDGEPRERLAEADVLVEVEAPRRAFPPPDFVHSPGEGWRSRWNAAGRKLEVNSGHSDYQAVRRNPARRRRYLGRLYAKELVLHNFGQEPPSAVLERLLEVLTRLDEHL